MSIKGTLGAVTRVSVSIFIALLALSLVIALVSFYMDYQKKQDAKPFEEMRIWSQGSQENLGVGFVVRTKLIEGRMMVAVTVSGHPSYLDAPYNADREFVFNFHDGDGFQIYSRAVKVSDFTGVVDVSGKRTGLRYQFSDYVGLDNYKRFSQFNVTWSLDTNAAKVLSKNESNESTDALPKPSSVDPCAPGLSKAERLRRLGKNGEVREVGLNSFEAGSRSVVFGYDERLIYCN